MGQTGDGTAEAAGGGVGTAPAAGQRVHAAGGAGVSLFERAVVEDFATWARAFADFAPDLERAGVIASAVYRSVDDPNDITVVHDFATLEAARAFLASATLKASRPAAGVDRTPTVWFAVRTGLTTG